MKKTLTILKNIITSVLTVAAVAMMIFTIVSVAIFDRTDRNLFGFKAFIVLTDSMSADNIKAGDLVVTQNVDPSTLKEGDIISYQSTGSENYGEIVTHKIRRLTTDAEGNPGFITYGTTTNTDDENVVTYPFILGQHKATLPDIGTFFKFLKTPVGYIVCIFIPFFLLICMQGFESYKLFKAYKAEQLAEVEEAKQKELAKIAEERARLEEERKNSQKMMEELMQMKEALGKMVQNKEEDK